MNKDETGILNSALEDIKKHLEYIRSQQDLNENDAMVHTAFMNYGDGMLKSIEIIEKAISSKGA